MKLRIEFLGTPGSGKSTLSKEVRHFLVEMGESPVLFGEAFWLSLKQQVRAGRLGVLAGLMPSPLLRRLGEGLFLRTGASFSAMKGFLLENPQVLEVMLGALRRRTPFELRPDLVLGWFLQLLSSYQLVSQHLDSASILIMEEGFCNRAISFLGYKFAPHDHGDLEAYMAAIPPPDLVFFVDTPLSVCEERLGRIGRIGSPRLQSLDRDGRRAFFRDARCCADSVAAILRKQGIPVHRVSNEGTIKGAGGVLQKGLNDILLP